MRQAGLLALLLALAGCGAPSPEDEVHPRQEPSNYEPGIHISGHANIGVVRRF